MRLVRRAIAGARAGIAELVRPGSSELSGEALWRLGQVALTVLIVATNLIGAAVIAALAMFVLPLPSVENEAHVRLVNGLVAAGYVAVAIPFGTLLGARSLRRLGRWLAEERPASPGDQRIVLQAPLRLFALQVALWGGAVALFTALNLSYSEMLALWVAAAIALTGITTAACAYLISERLLRPAAARALAAGTPERLAVPGVATRSVLAWALGTAVPVAGLLMIGIASLAGGGASRAELGLAMVVLAATALTVGLVAVTLAARATADPVDSVRRALARVQRGDLEIRIPVYDGTQVGQLQLGFNQMAEGLAERERIREAFGAYVDPEVAERVLEEGINLAGEEVEVTLMFVDVRDFTGFAERRPAGEVVATLNRLFELIVPIIHEHGGRIDKFIGDGLLAVFGAPRRLPDHADRALAAALEVRDAVEAHPEGAIEVGIGLNSGTVVAGNIGGAGRLDFSVIGDAVNVAARVEAATRESGDRILVAERTMELLTGTGGSLAKRPNVSLKGKREPVELYAPVSGRGTGASAAGDR